MCLDHPDYFNIMLILINKEFILSQGNQFCIDAISRWMFKKFASLSLYFPTLQRSFYNTCTMCVVTSVL